MSTVKVFTLAILLMLLLIGCGKKTDKADETASESKMTVDEVYTDITGVLSTTYEQEGKPKADWDGMTKVKDAAFEKLRTRFSEWPAQTSFSLSVMDDHIVVFVSIDGNEKEGKWQP